MRITRTLGYQGGEVRIMDYNNTSFSLEQKAVIRAYEKENIHYRGGSLINLNKRSIHSKTKSKLLKELNRIERETTTL